MKFPLKTPVYVIDEDKLVQNLQILSNVQSRTGAKILLAQKAFSSYRFYPLIGQYLSGTASSGLYEARLAHEKMGKENHVYSPAYTEEEFKSLVKICDHIVFNSCAQVKKFAPLSKGNSLGLRLNPQFSTQKSPIYDPCAKDSRLGVTKEEFCEDVLSFLQGFHIHTLCEQGAEELDLTVKAAKKQFGEYFKNAKWLNLGGGHHITKAGYNIPLLERVIKGLQDSYGTEVYLEPGEAVALNAGYLYTTVLEIVKNGMEIAILDASAECHMPDVLEMPYTPPLYGAGKGKEYKYTYRLSSKSCLAGDIIGDYSFKNPLKCGDVLRFDDMAIYTMVKNNTFNGMPLPSIAKVKGGKFTLLKSFGYSDFKSRL